MPRPISEAYNAIHCHSPPKLIIEVCLPEGGGEGGERMSTVASSIGRWRLLLSRNKRAYVAPESRARWTHASSRFIDFLNLM